MQRSLSQMLLVDSDLYLQAVQHKSVHVESLGLHEVKYPFNSVRNTSGRKVLKAVIPTDNQRDFLQKAGLIDETFPTIPEDGPASKMPTSHQRRKERAARRKKKEEDEKRRKSSNKKEEDDPDVVKHAARRTSIGGTPLFTKPSHAHLEILEREREDAIWRTKQKERFVKLGETFDIVDKEGVKYVYDYRGFKVTEEEFERQMAAIEKEKQRKSVERTIHPHNCAIIEKTRRFVDDMRRKVEEDMILDYRWYPGKFPSTTVPPRCQSAGSTRRSFSNDLRDINSLGKSLPSPFRDGVTPVLPVDLVHKWPEYRVMEEGDVVLTIEHCCNCWEHSVITHHKEEHYLQLADEVKEALSASAMKFAVRFYAVHKPVHFQDPLHKSLSQSEKLINKEEGHGHRPEIKAFNVDYTTRLGAFEVQVAIKTRNNFVCHLLFSKLFRGVWPKVGSLQKLLERLLSEARFKRMDSDSPEETTGAKSPKSGMRRQSTKVVLVPKKAVEDEVGELQAEFDLREKYAPLQESKVPFSGTESAGLTIDTITATATEENSGGGTRSRATSAEAVAAAPPSLDEVEAAYQRYQELHRAAQLQRGEQAAPGNEEQPRPALNRVGSTKATIKAVGAASAGLHMVRGKSQSAKVAEHTGLISEERAMEIANTHSERLSLDPSHPNFTKKGSSIGVLSRQNAGGGQGRYLHIEDEEPEPDEHGDAPGQLVPVSPPAAMLTRASSMASGAHSSAGSSAKSPYTRSNSTMSSTSGKAAPLNRGSSTVSVTPFTRASSTLQNYEEVENDDESQIGFSPNSSSKSIAPVATAVSLTTSGLALVRHRAASISALASAPSVIEKLRMATHKAQSEKAMGGAKRTSPKNGPHRPAPSLEMRKKLDIGLLSRQSAAKGGKLIVPDDDSDDGAGSDLSDSVPPMPIKRITDAMKEAVTAVNVATEASEKRAAVATTGNAAPALASPPATAPSPTPAAAHPPAMVIAPIPAYAPTAVHPKVPVEPATISTPAVVVAPAPVTRESPAAAHKSAANTSAQVKESTPVPTVAVVPASATPVIAQSAEKGRPPQANDAAATTTPLSAEALSQPVQPGVVEAAPEGPKLSAAELLLQRRRMTEQLFSEVSKDIFQRADSQGPATIGEYGDDFEDFDNFSPTKNNNATGFEDLFDTAEFQLSQISEGTQERA